MYLLRISIITAVVFVLSARNFDLKMSKIVCDINPKYLENLTCYVKAKRKSFGLLNMAVDLKVPLHTGWV